jgi:hypothetical protein
MSIVNNDERTYRKVKSNERWMVFIYTVKFCYFSFLILNIRMFNLYNKMTTPIVYLYEVTFILWQYVQK